VACFDVFWSSHPSVPFQTARFIYHASTTNQTKPNQTNPNRMKHVELTSQVTMEGLTKGMKGLWDKLVRATSSNSARCCSSIQTTFQDEEGLWADLSPCSFGYCNQPEGGGEASDHVEIPRIVSISDDDDCHDSISDIGDVRHCSVKPPRESRQGESPTVESKASRTARAYATMEDLKSAPELPSVVCDGKKKGPTAPPADIPPIVYDRPKPKQGRSSPPPDYPSIIYQKNHRRFVYI
jgi:hypothetical protein